MALSGRYVTVDIGHVECKIAEVNIAGSVVSVLNTTEMRDLSPFISTGAGGGTLMNFSGFVDSFADTLKTAGINSNRLLIASSVLGIKTRAEEQSSKNHKDTKDLDKYYQETCGRQTSNIAISDYQLFGTIPTETDIQYKIMVSTCGSLIMLKDLINTLVERRFIVTQIQSDVTALCNLSKFYKPNYDQPALVLIDMGSLLKIYTFKLGTLTFENKQPSSLCSLAKTLHLQLDMPVIKAKKLLYTIGVIKSESNMSELYRQSIDGALYFQIVYDELQKDINAMSSYVKTMIKDKGCGNAQVSISGGILDIPGLAEAIEAGWRDIPVKAFGIETLLAAKVMQVNNKQDKYLTSKFATCIGAAVVNSWEKSTNLVPKESVIIDMNDGLLTTARAVKFLTILSTVVAIGYCVFLGTQWLTYSKVPEYLEQTTTAITKAKSVDTKYKDYLSAIQDIDDIVEPLMEFIAAYPQESLSIASFDTPDMLIPVEVDENGKPVAPKDKYTFNSDGLAVDAAGNLVVDENGNNVTRESVAEKETEAKISTVKQDIIIRGYANTSAEVTSFYTKLQSQSFVPQLAMIGVKEITLQTEEKLYIFEMRIVRTK